MARLKLEIHPEAAVELERSYEFYASRSFVAAVAFVHGIDAALESILENPLLWPKYLERYRRRILSRFPFSIVGKRGFVDKYAEANWQLISWPDGGKKEGILIGRMTEENFLRRIGEFVHAVAEFKRSV